MTIKLFKPGTEVMTKHGVGVITVVDKETYDIPMYHVLLFGDKYEEPYIYIVNTQTVSEIPHSSEFQKGYNIGIDVGYENGYKQGVDEMTTATM